MQRCMVQFGKTSFFPLSNRSLLAFSGSSSPDSRSIQSDLDKRRSLGTLYVQVSASGALYDSKIEDNPWIVRVFPIILFSLLSRRLLHRI